MGKRETKNARCRVLPRNWGAGSPGGVCKGVEGVVKGSKRLESPGKFWETSMSGNPNPKP